MDENKEEFAQDIVAKSNGQAAVDAYYRVVSHLQNHIANMNEHVAKLQAHIVEAQARLKELMDNPVTLHN